MISYPIFANWVWGGGWLSQLGRTSGLGTATSTSPARRSCTGGRRHRARRRNGAGAGASASTTRTARQSNSGPQTSRWRLWALHPRLRLVRLQPGSTLAAGDLRISVIASTRCCVGVGRDLRHVLHVDEVAKPDPSMMINGCSPVWWRSPRRARSCRASGRSSSVLFAGLLVCWSVFYVERSLKVDDPVGPSRFTGRAAPGAC